MKNLLIAIIFLALLQPLSAQSVGTPIIDQTPGYIKKTNASIIAKIRPLIGKNKLLSREEVNKRLPELMAKAITLLPVKQQPLSREEVADVARAASLRVGYCYLCPNCKDWHLELSGGYAIAPDVVVTCDHVINSPKKMREGYLIVVDQEGNTYPATTVITRSATMDAALIRVDGANFKPLALNVNVRQGAAAYCYSTPLGQIGYFSEGIVNRFLWEETYQGGDKEKIDVARHLRVGFSTDWAQGSSGAAVLDQAGNVIGHVYYIENLVSGGNKHPSITIRTGIPAHAVRMLAETVGNAAETARLAALEAKELAAETKSSE